MKKEEYQFPEIKVIKLNVMNALLVGSDPAPEDEEIGGGGGHGF